MSVACPRPVTNQLLDCLPHNEQNRVLEQCEMVELEFGSILTSCDARYAIARYFSAHSNTTFMCCSPS